MNDLDSLLKELDSTAVSGSPLSPSSRAGRLATGSSPASRPSARLPPQHQHQQQQQQQQQQHNPYGVNPNAAQRPTHDGDSTFSSDPAFGSYLSFSNPNSTPPTSASSAQPSWNPGKSQTASPTSRSNQYGLPRGGPDNSPVRERNPHLVALDESLAALGNNGPSTGQKPTQPRGGVLPPSASASKRSAAIDSINNINEEVLALEKELKKVEMQRGFSGSSAASPGPVRPSPLGAASPSAMNSPKGARGNAMSPQQDTSASASPSGPPTGMHQRSPSNGDVMFGYQGHPASPATQGFPSSPLAKPSAICAACSQPINGPALSALQKTWHPGHFVCSGCETVLSDEPGKLNSGSPAATAGYFERDGEPFCEACFVGAFGTRCAYCEEVITEKCITALEASWHPHHFFCSCCGEVFRAGAGFLEKDGKAYCEADYFQLFSNLCKQCMKPIMGEYVSAMDAEFHIECFVCQDCEKPFPDGVFFELNSLPYCEEHYNMRTVQPGPTAPTRQQPNAASGLGAAPNDPTAAAGAGHTQPSRPTGLTCPTCGRPEPPPLTAGTVVDRLTRRRYCAGHYVCARCQRGLKGGIVMVVVGGDPLNPVAGPPEEREAGLTRGEGEVAARVGDAGEFLLCERCAGAA
ncbi:hypothetical protein HK405_012098 [Cladochytrium tenue]|nr:hypothetical protein HK405_012098 [Cladochytrium tenue]